MGATRCWSSSRPDHGVRAFSRTRRSIELLGKRGPEIETAEAERLAEKPGDLPLAIEQAAAWRAVTGMPVSVYLRPFDESVRKARARVSPEAVGIGAHGKRKYVGVADRRCFVPLDETDIPLLGADGALHIVELKGPSISRMIVRHRNHWIVGFAVHEAAAQAMNYLRGFDEAGLAVSGLFRNELGQEYDMSRVFATVVIGHTGHRNDCYFS